MAQNSGDKDERKEEVGEGGKWKRRRGESRPLYSVGRGWEEEEAQASLSTCWTEASRAARLMGKCREEERSGHRRASRHSPFRWRQQRAWWLVAGSPGLDTDSPTE